MTAGTIMYLVAGVPVSHLDAGKDWYTRLLGREPDLSVGDEVLRDVDEHATPFADPDPARAGSGRVTFAVTGLDALLERLTRQASGASPSRLSPTGCGT